MNKNTLLYILLAFLIVVNGIFLYNYLGKPSHKGPPNGPESFIIKELNFDATQMKEFEGIQKKHREEMMLISGSIKQLKDELFQNISVENINENKIDSITTLIGENEKRKDLEVFHHFRSIQNICNKKQKKQFIKIVQDALHKGPPPFPNREHKPPQNKMIHPRN